MRFPLLFRLLLLLLALLPLAPALAQVPDPAASTLPRLLAERRALVQQYSAASAQRHGLLGLTGKPSKKDLQEVVDALQGIVDKDSEIVAVLEETSRQARSTAVEAQTTTANLQNTSRDDRNLSSQRLNELQNELLNAQQRDRQASTRQQALTTDLAEAEHGQHLRDAAIAALAVFCVGLLLWRRRR